MHHHRPVNRAPGERRFVCAGCGKNRHAEEWPLYCSCGMVHFEDGQSVRMFELIRCRGCMRPYPDQFPFVCECGIETIDRDRSRRVKWHGLGDVLADLFWRLGFQKSIGCQCYRIQQWLNAWSQYVWTKVIGVLTWLHPR